MFLSIFVLIAFFNTETFAYILIRVLVVQNGFHCKKLNQRPYCCGNVIAFYYFNDSLLFIIRYIIEILCFYMYLVRIKNVCVRAVMCLRVNHICKSRYSLVCKLKCFEGISVAIWWAMSRFRLLVIVFYLVHVYLDSCILFWMTVFCLVWFMKRNFEQQCQRVNLKNYARLNEKLQYYF